MNHRIRAWLLILLIAAICGASLWAVAWYRGRALTPAALLARVPRSGAVVVYVDFAALRRSGLLDELDTPKVSEDPEYQSFVRGTDFDYKQDLDAALVAFAPTGKYLLVRGRFDWKSLRGYANSQNGRCFNSLCRMPGSTPERRISFFPLQQNLMALAVSADDSAAVRMINAPSSPAAGDVPDAPVWISIPGSVLKSQDALPADTRLFAQSIGQAESVSVSFVPEGNRLSARLNVRCHSDQEASTLAAQLSRATGLLRQMIASQHHTPNPADLTGVLTSGSFRSAGARVYGYWPIERSFVDNILGGQS